MLNTEHMCDRWIKIPFQQTELTAAERLVFLTISCCADERGQGATSVRFIVKKTALNQATVSAAITRLKQLGYIENTSANSYRLVVIGI